MTSHAGTTFVHGTPRASRQRRARRNRLFVTALLAAALVWGGHRAWSMTTASARPDGTTNAAAGPASAADDHAPTGSDDLDGLATRMRGSVQAAIDAAAVDGVSIEIVSAHRSAADQQVLYDQAIARYGSARVARRWVLPPEESEHVRGGAVDVGPRAAATWLERNGVRFGLCRRYVNEWWHFERLAGPRGATCPRMEPYAGG